MVQTLRYRKVLTSPALGLALSGDSRVGLHQETLGLAFIRRGGWALSYFITLGLAVIAQESLGLAFIRSLPIWPLMSGEWGPFCLALLSCRLTCPLGWLSGPGLILCFFCVSDGGGAALPPERSKWAERLATLDVRARTSREKCPEWLNLEACWGEHPGLHVSPSFASYLLLCSSHGPVSPTCSACNPGFSDFGGTWDRNGVSAPSILSCYSSAFCVRFVLFALFLLPARSPLSAKPAHTHTCPLVSGS